MSVNMKKQLKESISESAITPLSYLVFIDAADAVDKVRGYIRIIFPSETPSTIREWFRPLVSSKEYKTSKDKLQAIQARFSNNPSLKSLIKSLEKIKSMSYTDAEKESHENDIRTLINKTSLFIQRRLTSEDIKVLESMLSQFNHVSEKISEKIDNEVAALATEPDQTPDIKAKTEIKVNERVKNKLRKKIKEIVRTHLMSNRYR